MKNTNPTQHGSSDLNPTTPAGNAAVRHVFKLGLDADLNFLVTAIQCDQGSIALPQKFTRQRLILWVQKQTAAGHTVHTVYESCGFGYTLHYALGRRGRAVPRDHAHAALSGSPAETGTRKGSCALQDQRNESKENWERKTNKLLEKKNCPPHHNAFDNPHRRCSVLLGVTSNVSILVSSRMEMLPLPKVQDP